MNVIYENSTDTELGSCWGCVVTVGKELPCVYDAVKAGSFGPLLNCGVDKSDVSQCYFRFLNYKEVPTDVFSTLRHIQLCNCADCLPDVVKKFVDGFCQAKGKPKAPSLKNPPVQAERIADADLNFQGFKGSLLKSTAKDLKAVNFCPGTSCGSCGCCVGVCVFGACGGACVG
jgi:hypothetical protein